MEVTIMTTSGICKHFFKFTVKVNRSFLSNLVSKNEVPCGSYSFSRCFISRLAVQGRELGKKNRKFFNRFLKFCTKLSPLETNIYISFKIQDYLA